MTPAVTITECSTPNLGVLGTIYVLFGFMIIPIVGDGFAECSIPAVTTTEQSTPAVALEECLTPPVTITEQGI